MEPSTLGPCWLGAVVASTTRPAGFSCGVGVEGPVGVWWWGMEVARCWALRDQAPASRTGCVVLVVLWLFGCWIVDASIFVAVCSDQVLFLVSVLFCCVGVCGDKL